VDRVDRVLTLLHDADTLTPAQVKGIANDIGRHDYRADALLPYLFGALAAPGVPADPRLGDVEQMLRDWDHRADDGSVGETIFDAWRVRVFRDTFADELGEFLTPLEDPFNPTGDSFLLRCLQGSVAGLPVARDYFDGVDQQVMLVGSLIAALDELTAQFGTEDMQQWGWDPGTIEFTFGPFTFGEVPWHSRGSYMQFVEMTRPVAKGENVLPPGNSGTLLLDGDGLLTLDPHFLDQLDLYRDWQYKPMPLRFYPVSEYLPVLLN
jgi:acyl-homoserine lactone acylase PvdQ